MSDLYFQNTELQYTLNKDFRECVFKNICMPRCGSSGEYGADKSISIFVLTWIFNAIFIKGYISVSCSH